MKLRVHRNIRQLRIREGNKKLRESRKTLGDILIETAKRIRAEAVKD